MFGMTIVTGFLTLYLLLMASFVNLMSATATAREINEQAGHMAIYSSLVSAYVQANPSFTGSVSDANATLPTWFKRLPSEKNYASGGVTYVYSSATSRATGFALAKAVGGGVAGIDDSGTLTLPGKGVTGTAIPGVVPNGSVVIIR